MKNNFEKKINIYGTLLLLILPVIVAVICLCLGRMSISPREIFLSLTGDIGSQKESVIWAQRFPRIITAAIVGAGLSCSGAIFQSMFSNPLATPDTLGVASGAGFGAAIAILLGAGLLGIQASAFVFGMVAIILTEVSGGRLMSGKTTMILSGIMVGSLFSALISLVKFTADTESQLPAITYWLMGSLSSVGYRSLKFGAPVIIIGLLLTMLLRHRLNLLALSDDEARSLGTNVTLLRTVAAVIAAAMTASSVAMCGQVGWVGLLVPHICRMTVGNNHKYLIPASISVGAAFMMTVDTLARTLTAAEIPVSVLTAIIGAPFFIILLKRSGGQRL